MLLQHGTGLNNAVPNKSLRKIEKANKGGSLHIFTLTFSRDAFVNHCNPFSLFTCTSLLAHFSSLLEKNSLLGLVYM